MRGGEEEMGREGEREKERGRGFDQVTKVLHPCQLSTKRAGYLGTAPTTGQLSTVHCQLSIINCYTFTARNGWL
jgi:hypothetical protein